MIYFVGDLHFGHSNILEYEKETRGKYWSSAEEMNKGLIKLWNETITKDDIVYNIGDFFFNMKPKDVKRILKQLNYKKMILIAGNHDHRRMIKLFEQEGITVKYADMIKRDGVRYYLSHYPTLIGRKIYIIFMVIFILTLWKQVIISMLIMILLEKLQLVLMS